MAFFAVLTASFFSFFVITFLIVVHEIGHFLIAYLCGGKLLKILIYPLGGISKFSTAFNLSLLKEFLILIFGPLFQMLAYYFLIYLFPEKQGLIFTYHWGILFFNLLPIYPLDGGKLVCLLFHHFLPYKRAFYVTFLLGYLLLFCFFYFCFLSFSINVVFLTTFLFIKLLSEFRKVPYYYERFLLERYLNHLYFSKSKVISSIQQFQRSYRHLIKVGDCYYLEREYLEKKYKNC